MMNGTFNAALSWHSRGIATIPIIYCSKKPIVKYKQYKDELPTVTNLVEWFCGSRCNMAILTTENLIILDFDNPIEYGYWFCYQMAINPKLIDTYMVMTSRGLHLYYWIEEPFDKINIKEPYEIKSHGQLVTIPPSVHRSGIAYRPINSIDDIEKVNNIQELLTFSCVKFERPKPKLINGNSSIWQIQEPTERFERVDLLDLFPDARQTDDNGRFWITNCPMHGHKNNFWLDIEFDICGCYAGCTSDNGKNYFLASELAKMIIE